MSGHCGTEYGYQQHLRTDTPKCGPCRRAHADQRADYRRRRYLNHAPLQVDVTGSRRRIQALVAIGWSMAEQSRRMGHEQSVAHAITGRTWVSKETAEKVRALYDELSMTPGPSARARSDARMRGWPPPLAWSDDEIDDPSARSNRGYQRRGVAFDEVAVQRAMGGDRVHLRPAERAEAVRRLTAGTASVAHIADRLGVSPRSVSRLRSPQEAS